MTHIPGSSSIGVDIFLRPMNDKEKNHDTLPVITAYTVEKLSHLSKEMVHNKSVTIPLSLSF